MLSLPLFPNHSKYQIAMYEKFSIFVHIYQVLSLLLMSLHVSFLFSHPIVDNFCSIFLRPFISLYIVIIAMLSKGRITETYSFIMVSNMSNCPDCLIIGKPRHL